MYYPDNRFVRWFLVMCVVWALITFSQAQGQTIQFRTQCPEDSGGQNVRWYLEHSTDGGTTWGYAGFTGGPLVAPWSSTAWINGTWISSRMYRLGVWPIGVSSGAPYSYTAPITLDAVYNPANTVYVFTLDINTSSPDRTFTIITHLQGLGTNARPVDVGYSLTPTGGQPTVEDSEETTVPVNGQSSVELEFSVASSMWGPYVVLGTAEVEKVFPDGTTGMSFVFIYSETFTVDAADTNQIRHVYLQSQAAPSSDKIFSGETYNRTNGTSIGTNLITSFDPAGKSTNGPGGFGGGSLPGSLTNATANQLNIHGFGEVVNAVRDGNQILEGIRGGVGRVNTNLGGIHDTLRGIAGALTNNGGTNTEWSTNVDVGLLSQKGLAETEAHAKFDTMFDGLDLPLAPPTVGSGSAAPMTVSVGTGAKQFTMDLAPDARFSTFLTGCRMFIEWFIVVGLFYANWTYLEKYVMNLFIVPQATTAGQSVLGNNVNAASAVAAAVIIVAVIATVPTAGLVLIHGGETMGVSPDTGATGVSAAWGLGWYLLNLFVPMQTIISALVSHILMRVFVMKLFIVAAAIVKILVGI
jgi:hypothetical protein